MNTQQWSSTLVTFFLGLILVGQARGAAVVEIVSLDGAGEGLNDAAPFNAEGGNTGPTLGEARRQVVAFAAAQWAETLDSVVPIRIGVSFDSLGGTASQATLGTGRAEALHRDFVGAPHANTWYPSALAQRGQLAEGYDRASLAFSRY